MTTRLQEADGEIVRCNILRPAPSGSCRSLPLDRRWLKVRSWIAAPDRPPTLEGRLVLAAQYCTTHTEASALRLVAAGQRPPASVCSWPVARIRHHVRKRPHEVNHSAFMRPLSPHQISVCSEISSASSTSIPRYLTVLSNLLPAGNRLENTIRYLGIEVDDALELAEHTDI